MIAVEVFSIVDCSLCEKAVTTLERIRTEIPFDLLVTRLEPAHPKYEEYRDHIPVVHLNGRYVCRHGVDPDLFRTLLKATL